MALSIEHKAFGKWVVKDGELVIADGLTKAEAQAMAGVDVAQVPDAEPPAAVEVGAVPTHGPDGELLTDLQRRRLSEKRMEAALRAGDERRAEPFRALLFALHDPDIAQQMWNQIEPIVRAGSQGLRREVRRNQRITNGAAATA